MVLGYWAGFCPGCVSMVLGYLAGFCPGWGINGIGLPGRVLSRVGYQWY